MEQWPAAAYLASWAQIQRFTGLTMAFEVASEMVVQIHLACVPEDVGVNPFFFHELLNCMDT